MTVTIQIGNSDDKLTQERWVNFLMASDLYIRTYATQVYFSGVSYPNAPWQNAAWVFDITPGHIVLLKTKLSELCKNFEQDSIAWTQGDTEFIGAAVKVGADERLN